MGLIWEGFGTVWGLSNALGLLLAVSGIQNRGFVQAMVQAGLQEATGIDFGRIWESFWEGFRWIWEGLRKPLGRLLVNFLGSFSRTFWGPRFRRGSGGLLGRFWCRFWVDFGKIFKHFLDTVGTCFWGAADHGLGNF